MSLVTRCNVCGTAFRVQRAQLSARGGKVRCGKCAAVFDGVAGLVEEGAEMLRLEPSPQLGLFDPSRRPQRAAVRAVPADDEDLPVPEFLAREEPRRHAWLWGLAALVAVLALAAQAAYRYRTELAVLAPETRPALLAACRTLGCTLQLPRRPDLLGIESSDLQADGKRENVIILNAVLRNRAPFPQEYPALELTLTDDADRPVVRRVLRPADYLEPARMAQVAAGIAPGGEAAFRLSLDASRARATGYRLYLFFPQ
ncbi:MAG TPA: zinc-ribbon and DUF3426 domain-containing protein [Burkholderiales bacterium]|nr:zinc-ribbon and DUF3426 domain-containing protein [Burkholderiales bacterium]